MDERISKRANLTLLVKLVNDANKRAELVNFFINTKILIIGNYIRLASINWRWYEKNIDKIY